MKQEQTDQVLCCVINQTMLLHSATAHVKVGCQAPLPIKSTYAVTATNTIQQTHANTQAIQ